METVDPALVARARDGDVEAFGELFRATHRRIYNFVRHMVMNPEDAADLTQRAYVSAWRGLKALRANAAFLVWLHRVALNAVRDARKRPVRPTVSLDAMADDDDGPSGGDVPDWSRGPAEIALSKDTQAVVRRAVCSLPEIHRGVVTMHHLEEMPVDDIAAVLDISRGTVLSRLARAREALHRKLGRFLNE